MPDEELINAGDEMEREGRLEEALAYWKAAAERQTGPYPLIRAGRLAVQLGKYDEAELLYGSAVDSDPQLEIAHKALGRVYLEEYKFELACRSFESALHINESAATYTLLGVAEDGLDQVVAARESFKRAIAIDPGYEEAYYNLATTFRVEDPAEAVRLLAKAVELDPQHAKAHRELGFVLTGLQRFDEAKHHLRLAIELDPSDAWTYMYLGNDLWAEGSLGAAESEFKKAVELQPDSSDPWWCLAMFLAQQGRTTEAEELYKTALRLDPDDAAANLQYGRLLKSQGRQAEARDFLEHVLEVDPDYPGAAAELLGLG